VVSIVEAHGISTKVAALGVRIHKVTALGFLDRYSMIALS
jgi:hypothetical protein